MRTAEGAPAALLFRDSIGMLSGKAKARPSADSMKRKVPAFWARSRAASAFRTSRLH